MIKVGQVRLTNTYGERQGLWAARAWLTLDYLGHGDKAARLDGNIEKWRSEDRPLTKEAPSIKPASFRPTCSRGYWSRCPWCAIFRGRS